eukprot:655086-Amphidinium_carterae.1
MKRIATRSANLAQNLTLAGCLFPSAHVWSFSFQAWGLLALAHQQQLDATSHTIALILAVRKTFVTLGASANQSLELTTS